ncbi:MAG: heavy metal translocating P-type ATPase [Vagococcus sp.]
MNHTHTMHEGDHMMGHDPSHHIKEFKTKFFTSLMFAIPILFLSPMMGTTLPFQFTFPGSQWIVTLLASVLFFYGGKPFFIGARSELSNKKPAMMTLITLGISVAYFYSLYAFIINDILKSDTHMMDFFWELASLILIMLLGHWIEMSAVGNAGNALQKMAELLPNDATVLDEKGNTSKHPLSELHKDQSVVVSAGETIPVDGVVIDGQSTVNESMVTGESQAIHKTIGSKVIGGSTNGNGTMIIQVTATGKDGYLSQVMALVGQAQTEKSRSESLSDKVAGLLFYIALTIGIVSFIFWLVATNDLNIALERLVTVLIIACPHALGLAIPLVVARSTSIGAKNGLLVKNRQVLEDATKTNVIFMDKTGTLTEGDFSVSTIKSFSTNFSDQDVLRIASALESKSSHPLATGIINASKQNNLNIPPASNTVALPGTGLRGDVEGTTYLVVNHTYLIKHSMYYDKELFNELTNQGQSISFLITQEESIGLIAQGDKIKTNAQNMIQHLIKHHITPVMLTGDNKQTAKVVAQQLGIEQVHAELMPEDKEAIIKKYHLDGYQTMMIGDGINDAPSLARADIGVAIGAGTDVAIESADVILTKSNPNDIIHLLQLAKHTTVKMTQNLWWGAGYNIIALPLAAGILAPIGIILSPAMGSVLMSLSTIIVAFNAMLLKIK